MVLQRPKNSALVKFLYKTAELYPNIGLKASWILMGYVNEYILQKENHEWADEVVEKLESHMVNRPSIHYEESDPKQLLIFSEKMYRSEYISFQNEFVDRLTQAAIKLKSIDSSLRPTELKAFFVGINNWIEKEVRGKIIDKKSKYKYYYKGIILPLDIGDDTNPTLILRVASNLGMCYNTKKRSPYKIVFEVIKLNDAVQLDKIIPVQDAKLVPSTTKSIIKPLAFTAQDPLVITNPSIESSQKLKGLSKFAKYIETVEENMKLSFENESKLKNGKMTPKPKPVLRLRHRANSVEDVKEYIKAQFIHIEKLKGPMNNEFGIDVEGILEKYRKKSMNEPVAKDEDDYIPFEKRLEGMADPFQESWEDIIKNHKQKSMYNSISSYDIKAYIVKGNDDLRQELMAIQFMKQLNKIYNDAGIKIYLRPYEIIITSYNSGIIGIF